MVKGYSFQNTSVCLGGKKLLPCSKEAHCADGACNREGELGCERFRRPVIVTRRIDDGYGTAIRTHTRGEMSVDDVEPFRHSIDSKVVHAAECNTTEP